MDNRIKVIVVVTLLKSTKISALHLSFTGLQVVMSSIAKAIGPLVSIFCGIIITSIALFILPYDSIGFLDLLDWTSKSPQVNIALLLLFAIIIFAIVGLEFYAGALNKTCYDINNLREFLMS